MKQIISLEDKEKFSFECEHTTSLVGRHSKLRIDVEFSSEGRPTVNIRHNGNDTLLVNGRKSIDPDEFIKLITELDEDVDSAAADIHCLVKKARVKIGSNK